MILCIDSGNTRLKWGLHAAGSWIRQGALLQAEIPRLRDLTAHHARPECIMIANVAGPAVAQVIESALKDWDVPAQFVRSTATAGGVRNGYDNPGQLGVDRWCALIGARSQTHAATVVVGSGTATTIDTLDAAGNFLGGFILPGLELMRSSLARHTAQLPLASGDWSDYPRCTDDAIAAGCLEAQLGAVERAFSRLADQPGASCLLFGGGASILAEHLDCPHRLAENLVLDGLRMLAANDTTAE